MRLESPDLDLMFPHFVVQLDIVQDGVDKALNVWILVTKEFKNDGDHLGLMEDNVSSWGEEEELEEGVQDLLHHLVIFLLGAEQILQHLNQIRGGNHRSDTVGSANGRNEHDALENDIIFGKAIYELGVNELDEVGLFDDLLPAVGVHVDHCTKKLKQQIRILTAILCHNGIVFQMNLHHIEGIRIELCNISHTFEKECVTKLTGSTDEFTQLAVLGKDLTISLIGGQVDSKCHELFADKVLRRMDNKLIDQWYAIRIGKSCLGFIFQAKVIEQLYYLGSEARSFECVDELRNHSLIIHLNPNLLVKTEIEKHPQSNLQEERVITRNESVQFFDDPQIFHLIFIFSKNGQFLQKVQNDEKQVGIVSFEHGHQKGDDLPVFHLALNLQILCQIEKQMESHKKDFFLFFNNHGKLFLVLVKFFVGLFPHLAALHLFQFDGLLLELTDSDDIPLDFVVDNLDGCITDLVGKQEFVELGEVTVCLEDIE